MRKTITDNSIACVHHFSAQQCPQRAPPSISRQATFRLPSSSTPRTPPQIILPYMHTPLWRIAHKQTLGILVRPAMCCMQVEPAVRPAATLTKILPRHFPGGRVCKKAIKPPSGHMLLCLAAWRIVTSSGQDRVCLTSNRDPIGLGHNGRASGAAAHDAPAAW